MRLAAPLTANARPGAVRFAAAVLARYRFGRARVPILDRVDRLHKAAAARAHSVSVHFRIDKRLRLTLAPLRTTAVLAGVRPVLVPAGAAADLGERILRRALRDDGRIARPPASPDIVRVPRPGSLAPAPEMPERAPQSARGASSPPRVLRRAAPLEPPPPAAATVWPARDEVRRQAELSTAELDRVTSHVMRTLDRRIHAWRERRGGI